MPACGICGVNMTASERVVHHDGKTSGNFHFDCSYLDWVYQNEVAPAVKATTLLKKNSLTAKKNGQGTNWP